MEKDLEGALVNSTEAKLEGSKKPLMDLGDHLEYIESLLEQGASGGDVDAKIAALKEYVDASIGQAVTNVLTEEF